MNSSTEPPYPPLPTNTAPPASVNPSPSAQPQQRVVPLPQSRPMLTYAFLGINIIIFLADQLLGGQLTVLGAKANPEIANGEYWRLITPIFLHANLLHLGFNSYFLYVMGPRVEGAFGNVRFLLIYLLAGISGAVLSFILSVNPSIGASGALFGLLGALLAMLYRNRSVLAGTRERIMSILQVVGINLLIGLSPGIDNWGHVGGLIGGLVIGWFASPQYLVRWDIGEVRLEDKSSIVSAVNASLLFGVLLGGVVMLVILMRHGAFPTL
jgi:rhomboid protease GluP